MQKSILNKYYPMTETAFYILLSFLHKRHGYETIKYVELITNQRLTIGAGTIYNTIGKFVRDGLIECIESDERKKIYLITNSGKELLKMEMHRIEELHYNSEQMKEKLFEKENYKAMGTMVIKENKGMA